MHIGITEGLLVGVLISIVMIIHASAFPRIVHLGRLPESEGGHFKDLARFKYAEQFPGRWNYIKYVFLSAFLS
jgi:MFS superfamily sulfate permease-like transporter